MGDEEEVVQVRPGRPSDTNFVTSSWLRSLRAGGRFTAGIPNDVYYQMHHRILELLIPKSLLLVLCNADDPDQIIAWACVERQPEILLLHYVYVKHSLRGNGFMSLLLQQVLDHEAVQFKICTHMTTAWDALRPRDRGWVYNPYALFTALPEDWGSE